MATDKEWLDPKDLEEEGGDEGGEDGGGWSSGEPLVDPSIFGLDNEQFLKMIRAEEAKFSRGWVPYTKDPNKKRSGGLGEGPPAHPLLSESSQFSGVDPKITADPSENMSEDAQNRYELRPNLTPSPAARPSAAPTFKPV